MTEDSVDLLIIGGGINGAGIARDAAGRGLSVMLCEQGDLGGATSSASTKLIHGGLRYLEHYEFRLVREALSEREVLLALAPHIIRPLRFVLPHGPGLRPAWLIRLGLFIYDHLGKRKSLAASGRVDLAKSPLGAPLRPEFKTGFQYADCWVDDARLVVLNAIAAAEAGANILTRTRCAKATPDGSGWTAELVDRESGGTRTVRAKVLVNAAGPWAARFIDASVTGISGAPLRLVRGSHIVVSALFEHDSAYIFQNPDGRIVFAIPYEGEFTLIGTTDVDHDGDPSDAAASSDEIAYLCEAAGRFLRQPIAPSDVVWSFAGVRPLLDEGGDSASSLTRDYELHIDHAPGGAPILSVFGGKITTYRKLAEQALGKLADVIDVPGKAWTASRSLPGGDFERGDRAALVEAMSKRYPWLPLAIAWRYVSTYGTRMALLLDGASGMPYMGRHFGAGLYEREVRYLVDHEWAMTADDVLWRRTKRGLHGGDALRTALEAWFHERAAGVENVSVAGGGR